MAHQPERVSSALSPASRVAGLAAAQRETFDVVIIGGGVNGVGAALDAASRGLSVCVVEKRDLAAGTSSRSSKLVHGGLRYLEQRDFSLVREALRERRVLVENVAPHLVKAAPFLLPLTKHYERPYIGAGVLLYDVLAGRHAGVPRHRHLSHRQCIDAVPSLDPKALIGGISYYDAQIDDARHTAVVARTAAARGAIVLTGVAVRRVVVEGERAVGVEAVDVDSASPASMGGPSEPFVIRGRSVLNTTGVWTTSIEESAGVATPLRVRASKGIHVVVPRSRIRSSTAMILRTERSVLFLIPWGDRWLIGTTDTDWHYDLDHPSATSTDIAYVLNEANRVLAEDLRPSDVISVYTGLRPLIAGGASSTTKLSREHAVNVGRPGLVTLAGGKYTTYRLMAADAIDAIGVQLGQRLPVSGTEHIPLLGAPAATISSLRGHAGAAGLHDDQLSHLIARYGSCAAEVLDLIEADPTLSEPVGDDATPAAPVDSCADLDAPDPHRFDSAHVRFRGGGRYLTAEVAHAVMFEGARHVDDVLTRRTRLSIESDDRGVSAVAAVARTMAQSLGWSSADLSTEIEGYRSRVDAERRSEAMPDDAASVAERSVTRDRRLTRAG